MERELDTNRELYWEAWPGTFAYQESLGYGSRCGPYVGESDIDFLMDRLEKSDILDYDSWKDSYDRTGSGRYAIFKKDEKRFFIYIPSTVKREVLTTVEVGGIIREGSKK